MLGSDPWGFVHTTMGEAQHTLCQRLEAVLPPAKSDKCNRHRRPEANRLHIMHASHLRYLHRPRHGPADLVSPAGGSWQPASHPCSNQMSCCKHNACRCMCVCLRTLRPQPQMHPWLHERTTDWGGLNLYFQVYPDPPGDAADV